VVCGTKAPIIKIKRLKFIGTLKNLGLGEAQ
jgi:hypothetical protein